MTTVRARVDDHGALQEAAEAVATLLADVHGQVQAAPDGAAWMPDFESAERAAEIGKHLQVAMAASRAGHVPSAFVLLRTALEQQLFDELLFFADRFEEQYTDVTDERFQEWEHDLEARQEPWTQGVVSLRRHGRNGAIVVRRGHDVTDGQGQVTAKLSPYYLWMQDHDPLVGRSSDQDLLDEGVIEVAARTDRATRNATLYRRFLSWSAICRNLELNDLWSERDLRKAEVHYRFLSAFTHGTHGGYSLLRRHQPPDHIATELVLLYAATIAGRELTALRSFLRAGGRSGFVSEDRVETAIRNAFAASVHLWFPGTEPHAFDRWKEANRRSFLEARKVEDRPPLKRPDEITSDDVGYYSDPLKRLTDLHRGATELISGHGYVPPW